MSFWIDYVAFAGLAAMFALLVLIVTSFLSRHAWHRRACYLKCGGLLGFLFGCCSCLGSGVPPDRVLSLGFVAGLLLSIITGVAFAVGALCLIRSGMRWNRRRFRNTEGWHED